jgi:predicted porin
LLYLRNAGSRVGIRVKHDLGEDFYALARTEWRFNGVNSGRDGFGDIYIKRAYAGLGSKQFGEVTFGRQVTIADDYGLTKDYEYGLISKGDYIETAGHGVVRYDYHGIDGLQVGANYNFAQDTNDKGRALNPAIKNAYGIGALYETEVAPSQKLIVKGGYGRTNYETNANHKHHKDGVILTLGYKVADLTLALESGYAFEKEAETKTNSFYVAPGAIYQVTPAVSVYGNYIYERTKDRAEGSTTGKEKRHGFLLGTDYRLHKQVVAFVEGKYQSIKDYDVVNSQSSLNSTVKDKAIGVGMRVFW